MNLKLSTLAAEVCKDLDLNDKDDFSDAVDELMSQSGLDRRKCRAAVSHVKRSRLKVKSE